MVADVDSRLVLGLAEIDRGRIAEVGGKAAGLGELARIPGVPVPAGFCVTTDAWRRAMMAVHGLGDELDRLSGVDTGDRAAIAASAGRVREAIECAPIPDDVTAAITRALPRTGGDTGDASDDTGYAVRSSATAEDLPTASFAGQQDTYLNVVGTRAVLDRVRSCWASLFTERAVTYRARNGIDHRAVRMAVVVQEMVTPDASGVLFTADPMTSNRTVASVEAVPGLGEALVSGLAAADRWTVRGGVVAERVIADKERALFAAPGGGTRERTVEPRRRDAPTLTDEQVVRLVALGRRIEAHLGGPQDIEWCLTGDEFVIVQSRPVTTLFPVPPGGDGDGDGDGGRVYVSVGHQQMMTDAMTPLGLSVWQMTTPRPMSEAGGRLFVDVTPILAVPARRDAFLETAGRSDPLLRDAVQTLLDRGDPVPAAPGPNGDEGPSVPAAPEPLDADPALVEELVAESRASLAAVERDIRAHRGAELFEFIVADFRELRRLLFDPRGHRVYMTAMDAAWWLNEHLRTWLGEENVADTLTRSAPGNVTSEMGLALLDVADVVRPHPEVVAYLRGLGDDDLRDARALDGLAVLPGGRAVVEALRGFLDRYGMRCVGEIDIGRPRWSERPAALVPTILGHVGHAEPGAARRQFDLGLRQASETERDVLDRLRALPDGTRKAEETAAMIARLRTFIGYREYPKYGMVSRYAIYRRALLEEAGRMVDGGVLDDREDIVHLRFDELHEAARTGRADRGLIRERREALGRYRALTPPRVLTSDGEALTGSHRRGDLPAGALAGLAVSRGTVEGRARIVHDMTEADLEPGDVLVTAFTDPSWSPAFVTISALVTEVGGLMTHGAVVAREYGLPAVVGVQGATRVILDGQRVRVNGTDGYVEILA